MIDPQLLDRWRSVPSAVAADVSGGAALVDPAIRPLLPAGRQPRLFGRAVTARCTPPDFGAVLRALDLVRPGEVLVIDAGGTVSHAMIGGILGGYLHRRGAAGIVCDGAVRDIAELAAMTDFAVHSRAVTPLGPGSWSGADVNVPVTVGGRTVAPGDLLLGDDDGVATLTPALADALIGKAEAKLALEQDWIASLAAGRGVAATFGLQD
jgi:4-hydroxy-4-methyl-2-oxoglutarate aldolase